MALDVVMDVVAAFVDPGTGLELDVSSSEVAIRAASGARGAELRQCVGLTPKDQRGTVRYQPRYQCETGAFLVAIRSRAVESIRPRK